MVPAEITVEVVFSPAARVVRCVTLSLPAHSTVRDALGASGFVAIEEAGCTTGIWGRRASLGTRLRDRDRVEVYRPLTVDPKEARRLRYRAHGEKRPKSRQVAKAKDLPSP